MDTTIKPKYTFDVEVDGKTVPLESDIHPNEMDQTKLGELVRGTMERQQFGAPADPGYDLYDEWGRIYPHWYDALGNFKGKVVSPGKAKF